MSLRTVSSRSVCLRTIAQAIPSIVASHHKASRLVLGSPLPTMQFRQSPLLLRSGVADQTSLAKPSGTNRGQGHPMPVFDRYASRLNCAETGLPGRVPGLVSPGSSSVRPLPCGDRRRQRRASIMRASVVLALLGLFCGSAVVMSEKPQPSPGAALVSPPAAAEAPVRAHAKAWPALPALSLSGMTSCLWSDDLGEASADANTGSGDPYARGC